MGVFRGGSESHGRFQGVCGGVSGDLMGYQGFHGCVKDILWYSRWFSV